MITPSGYDARTDQLLGLLGTLTVEEFARLAIACADQAGLSAWAQRELAEQLEVDDAEVRLVIDRFPGIAAACSLVVEVAP